MSDGLQARGRLRRAGAGGFWGDENPRNFALPVPGQVQTNQRAELFALVRIVEGDARALEVRSDSQYVVNGFRMLFGLSHSSHVDLWDRLRLALRTCRDRVIVTKVRGHATWSDVHMGRISLLDKIGNARADALAVQGASAHGHDHITARALEHWRHAETVQRQFLAILAEHETDSQEMREAIEFHTRPELRRLSNLAAAERQRRHRIRHAT